MLQHEEKCPSNVECSKLGDPCINCSFNETCIYGAQLNGTCKALINDCTVRFDFKCR